MKRTRNTTLGLVALMITFGCTSTSTSPGERSHGGSAGVTSVAGAAGMTARLTSGGNLGTAGTPSSGGTSPNAGAPGTSSSGGSGAAGASPTSGGNSNTGVPNTSGSGGLIASSTSLTGGASTTSEPTCTGATSQICSGSCVDISSSPNNCGRCSHDCGGGGCNLGVCQPTTIYTAPLPIDALVLSRSEVLFSTYDDVNLSAKLFACPLAGCTLTPRQLVTRQYPVESVAWVADGASPGIVVFESAPTQGTQRPTLYYCLDTGCSSTPSSAVSDGMGGFAHKLQTVGSKVFYSSQNFKLNSLSCGAGTCTDGTSLGVGAYRPFVSNGTLEYYVDSSSGYILSCDLTVAGTCTPATVLATNVSSTLDLQIVGTTLYWLMPGREGFFEGKIRRCSLPACSAPSDLVNTLNYPREMVVDESGAYIINAANMIQRCIGSDCLGGAQDWVSGTAPRELRADSSFVYWVDGASVRRVAK